MPRTRYISQKDWARSEILLSAAMGGRPGESVTQVAERIMREDLIRKYPVERRYSSLALPEMWDTVRLNNRVLKGYRGSIPDLIAQMDFGSRLQLYASATGREGETVFDIALKLRVLLRQLSPVRTGLYRRSHKIWIDGRPAKPRGLQKVELDSYAWVFNPLDYAAVHETVKYSKPYQRALRRAKDSFAKEWDLLLEFASPLKLGGQVYGGRYAFFNRGGRGPGARSREGWSRTRLPIYQVPIIVIAPLNTLPRTGFYWRKRRTLRSKPPLSAPRY